MKNIPNNYVQNHTKLEILKFIDSFKSQLIYDFKKYFNLIDVDTSIITEKNKYYFKPRNLDFDNLNNNVIYQIVEYVDFYLIQLLHEINDQNLGYLSYYMTINRDRKTNLINTIGEYKLLIEKNILLIDNNHEIFVKHIKEIINIINEILSKLKIKDIHFLPTKFDIIHLNQIRKIYPTIPINDAINELLANKNSLLLIDLDTSFEHINRKEILSFYKNATFFVKSKTNNEVFEIFNLYICPSINDINEHYKFDNNLLEKIKMMDVFNEFNDILGIEICFSKLLLFILNKMFIAEILSSPVEEHDLRIIKDNKLFHF